MIDPNKKNQNLQKIESTIFEIEKQFGKGAVMQGNMRMDVPVLCSTGSLKLDSAIGIGGIPEGKLMEIYGPESSGKTTATLFWIAEVQKMGGIAAFIDAEHALDPIWCTKLGVNMN